MIIVTYWIVLLVATAVQGLSSGAPSSACKDLFPQHSVSSQPSLDSMPYEVNMSEFICQSYIPTKQYNITLRSSSSTSQEPFKGFMIQGRTVADDSPVGSWKISSPLAKSVCSKNTAATHTSSIGKTSITLTWTAPPAGAGAITFKYTFVKSFAKIWVRFATKAVEETDRIKCISSTPVKEITTATSSSESATAVPVSTPPSKEIAPTSTSEDFSGDSSDSAVITSTSSIKFSSPSPTPTTPPPPSCENVTGYPLCSPDFCKNHRSKFARCSTRVDSCSECQVTTCRVCVHTNRPVDMPKECVEQKCENLRCVVKWSRCAYVKILTYQMKENDRKPENFKCFVPNCYKNHN